VQESNKVNDPAHTPIGVQSILSLRHGHEGLMQ
jgi:hypothetical protein